ncbi:rhamnan synthesis F family protein [Mesorhizobium sp.]|uniref:rhamnan synthesis F family protein n=1 Tax=Mesorhizobium sp. TaxID=1871066 RepID=UPI000FE5D7E1|nr:rhamnan synthesis F family protein [Mesorhizobium sp.]RWD74267.1 MAG: glycosyltransferase [Mesorhizobium sp.]
MTIRDDLPTRLREGIHLLGSSGRWSDDEMYRAGAALSVGSFEEDFLRPLYEATNLVGSPFVTWLELSAMGGPAPMNRTEAEVLATSIRNSALFDAAGYGRQLPVGMDPALHYAVVGERMGWRPSAGFDPSYYLDRYGDIADAGISPLLHYENGGRDERRQPVSLADGLIYPQLAAEGAPIILVLSHEASRTGAPVLGWNLVQHLSDRYRVVSLVLRGGELEQDFRAAAAVSIGPLSDYCHSADASRIAERIATTYSPLYAVANSAETRVMIPHLVALGVPTVALVHEFAAYVRPVDSMRQVFDFASHVVFPARTVAESSARFFSDMKVRAGVHIQSQGRNDPPRSREISDDSFPAKRKAPQGPLDEAESCFVVIGAGFVQIRKGVDLFIAVAAAARRIRPDLNFRFIWIGDGYDPVNDQGYSAYLAEQLVHSDLGDSLVIIPAVADLEPFYARADAFLMCSRLDPQPNVGIDAVTRGIPTICFEGACGTAEILSADADTRHLVVSHLDTHAAAEEICRLAAGDLDIPRVRANVARVGQRAYDMKSYVRYLDALGLDAAESMKKEDLETLVSSKAVDPSMLLPTNSDVLPEFELERMALLWWSLWGGLEGTTANPLFRRPCAGFHPQIYARAHERDCIAGRSNPLAHWLRNGRQHGPWSRTVFSPDKVPRTDTTQRVALHGHFHYPELAPDLCSRLIRNRTPVDLFLSTDSYEKAEDLRRIFGWHRGVVRVEVFPNRGRDIGAFLTGFAREIADGDYDVFGHVHGKRSLAAGAALGDSWRDFLWENLVGGEHAMLDVAAAAFAATPALGLLMAEDPHLVAWGENRDIAQDLAGRIGISTPLDDLFDFPIGTMFWARPAALRPLLKLGLVWDDWPEEPASYDGTIMHALERLLPFAARHAGLEVSGVRAPGTTW